MNLALSRGTTPSVIAVLIVLFALTGALSSVYHATRKSRAEARYRSGLQLAAQGQSARAVEEFRAALTYVHNDPRYRMALARSLIALGQWNEAETHLSELRENDPTSGPINLMLARIAAREGHNQEAVMYYQRAIYGLWPDHPAENRTSARFELVGLLERGGQEKQVLAELLDLSDETPETDYASRRRIAAMLLAHGSPQHAMESFRGILATNPNDAAAKKGLADSLFVLGDYPGARKAYREALDNGVNDPAIATRIAASDAILNLDPTLVRLSAGQRFDRAQKLVRLTTQSAQVCGALPPDLAGAAEKAGAGKSARRQDGDTGEMLTLAQQLWKTRQELCGNRVQADPTLAAVMGKLQKQ